MGKPIAGGHYSAPSSLVELDPGDNLLPTVDFRRVYASVVDGWIAPGQSEVLFRGRFEAFPLIKAVKTA